MSEDIKKTRSLVFYDVNGIPHLSICEEDGRNYRFALTGTQIAHLSERSASFVADIVRKDKANSR